MASCAEIKNSIQAYLDGEATPAAKLIFEQHMEHCADCHSACDAHKACAAVFFDAFRGHRLNLDMTPLVLAHLPEHEVNPDVAHTMTYRAKHPSPFSATVRRVLPVLAALVIVVSLGVLLLRAQPAAESTAIGLVVGQEGQASNVGPHDTVASPVKPRDLLTPLDRVQTHSDSRMVIMLSDYSQLKLDTATRVRVTAPREISLEEGQVCLNVARDGRNSRFRVDTPGGAITVLGTTFNVRVKEPNRVVVTVIDGEVQVENDTTFAQIGEGQQVELALGMRQITPATIENPKEAVAWASLVQPDPAVENVFKSTLADPSAIPASQVFVVENNEKPLRALEFHWPRAGQYADYCGYHVYLSDDRMNPLGKYYLPPESFTKNGNAQHEIALEAGLNLSGVRLLHVSMLPDYSAGTRELPITRVYGLCRPQHE